MISFAEAHARAEALRRAPVEAASTVPYTVTFYLGFKKLVVIALRASSKKEAVAKARESYAIIAGGLPPIEDVYSVVRISL